MKCILFNSTRWKLLYIPCSKGIQSNNDEYQESYSQQILFWSSGSAPVMFLESFLTISTCAALLLMQAECLSDIKKRPLCRDTGKFSLMTFDSQKRFSSCVTTGVCFLTVPMPLCCTSLHRTVSELAWYHNWRSFLFTKLGQSAPHCLL